MNTKNSKRNLFFLFLIVLIISSLNVNAEWTRPLQMLNTSNGTLYHDQLYNLDWASNGHPQQVDNWNVTNILNALAINSLTIDNYGFLTSQNIISNNSLVVNHEGIEINNNGKIGMNDGTVGISYISYNNTIVGEGMFSIFSSFTFFGKAFFDNLNNYIYYSDTNKMRYVTDTEHEFNTELDTTHHRVVINTTMMKVNTNMSAPRIYMTTDINSGNFMPYIYFNKSFSMYDYQGQWMCAGNDTDRTGGIKQMYCIPYQDNGDGIYLASETTNTPVYITTAVFSPDGNLTGVKELSTTKNIKGGAEINATTSIDYGSSLWQSGTKIFDKTAGLTNFSGKFQSTSTGAGSSEARLSYEFWNLTGQLGNISRTGIWNIFKDINANMNINSNVNITLKNILTLKYTTIPAWDININGSVVHNLTGLYYANNTAWNLIQGD